MKRILSSILALMLVFGAMPFAAFAAVDSQDPEFKSYLQEIGMTEEEFVTYLSDVHDYTLEDFENVEELTFYLGDLLNEENLQELIAEFEMTEEDFNLLLEEHGASVEDYIFYDDLYFDVTDWLYAEESTPITDETLQFLLDEFGFESKEELEAFLNESGDSIENYETIEDLTWAVSELYFMQSKDDLINTLDSFGLSLAEANRLANHVIALMENPELDVDQFFMSMEEIGSRMMGFPEFDSAADLSPEDIAEFIDVWNDLLELLQLDVDYFLTKDGQTTPLSFTALMQLESTNGADLLIKISNLDGELLADMIITKDMFDSAYMEETGENIEKTADVAEEVAVAVEKMPAQKPVAKTVKGGKLPNTASDYLQNTLAGLAIILLGAFVFRKVNVKRV